MLDRYFYHALWPTGKLIYKKRGKLKLPKTYIHIRSLVEDLREYNLLGKKVEIIGRFVKSKEAVKLTGKIVAFFENEGKVVSNITVETEKGEKYVIGGWNSSLEDIEAELITLKD